MRGPRRGEQEVAITGVGQSEVGRPSLKSGMRLTAEACLEAIADAELTPDAIDGVVCWPGDNSNGDPFSPVGPLAVKTMLGLKADWFGGGYEGPGPLAGVFQAAMAIQAGLADHVLVFRTITEASARARSKGVTALVNKTMGRDSNFMWQWCTPFNVHSVVNIIAMYAGAHFERYGTTSEQLAQIPLTLRRNAELNPKAVLRAPMTLDDYFASKIISTPLRLFDCDVHCDASTALVLSRRSASNLASRPPIRLEAVGTAMHQPYYWDQIDLTAMATGDAARMMWSRTDLKPQDVDTAQLYDGFSILALIWLENLGLCPLGEGGRFIEGGTRIGLTGELPLNTNGGQLSGGRTHGLGYVHEACSQLWGRAGARQIKDPQVAVAAAGGGPLAGCVLLVRD